MIFLPEQGSFADLPADDPRVVPGLIFLFLVIDLGCLKGMVQRTLHLNRKPVFNTAGQKTARDNQKENGRNRGETHEGGNQFSPESGTDGFLPPLKVMFNQIA